MTLHRTPVHHTAADLVRRGQIMWRAAAVGSDKPDGVPRMPAGFVYTSGVRLDPDLLVALYELRQETLLCVDGGVVILTLAGRQRLSEWDATRTVTS